MLFNYLICIKDECIRRDIKWDKNWHNICGLFDVSPSLAGNTLSPDWMLDETASRRVLLTHRRNLWWKDQQHYEQYMADARMVDESLSYYVCCPGKHAPYYYPTH